MSTSSSNFAGPGLAILGVFAPFVYVFAVAYFGSAARTDYSQTARAISELAEPGAENKFYVDTAFVLYNILAILGASGFYMAVSWIGQDWIAGGGLFVATTCISILMTFFPVDPISQEKDVPAMSLSGRIHIFTAGLTALLTMVTMGLITTAALTKSRFYPYGVYCACALAFQVLSGMIAALTAGKLHPLMGVAERVTIGNYLFWMMMTCGLTAGYYFYP